MLSQAKTSPFTYFFGIDAKGKNLTEGQASMKNLLGGKGANLAEMAKLGLPVPPGFTISTEACIQYYSNGNLVWDELKEEILKRLSQLENTLDRKFGSETAPLLISVRSGARKSMPGMMDTILNLGLNDRSVEGLAKNSNDARFAYDCYRRFIQMYSDVVLEIHGSQFEFLLEDMKSLRNVDRDDQLTADDLKELVKKFKRKVLEESGNQFPQDPTEQLWGAIRAVFSSWNSDRAIHYRKMEGIPNEWGTAVNIQSMVFGNMGDTSGTGVAFTRDPSTGEKILFGEFLINAQGEDVVAGIRTPQPLTNEQKSRMSETKNVISLEETLPEVFHEFVKYQALLESHYKDMQDLEFTIQQGKLYLLQTRTGKRTTQAAVKTAVDMVEEKLISEDEAVLRIDPYSLDQLLHPRLDPTKKGTPLAKGLPASPGAVSGKIALSSASAMALKEKNEAAILVRHETSPEDIQGMDASVGILTALGGMTSHAAVVARGMGKSCIVGCADLRIKYADKTVEIETLQGKLILKEGDIITLDANAGEVFKGSIPTVTSELNADFETLMLWADKHRKLKVRTNADTPHDARIARQFGAEGIGLCRTEHMFFEEDRIEAVRAMILSNTQSERAKALESILPMQRGDFVGIFREMRGLPVTIRLLDPPLHEFLPKKKEEIESLAIKLGVTSDQLFHKVESLHEFNPMLGHRGCRLGISFPEIYEMQARAIAEAMVEASQKSNDVIQAEIMIPLVMEVKELSSLRTRIEKIVHEILDKAELRENVLIGTMIEIPRAALLADQIANCADFFSFGTNDLTQMTLGISRDDSNRFLPEYVDLGLLDYDPFMSLDQAGVGQLVKMAVQKGRQTKPGLKTGVCGEHGGDPRSIEFFSQVGLDYISCSPYRIPTARLAAAQSAIRALRQN